MNELWINFSRSEEVKVSWKACFYIDRFMNSLRCHFEKKEKKGWLFMAMVWNVKFDWLGNLFIGFSQRLKYRNTGSIMVTSDICVKTYTPSTVFMFKLATSNNFVLLLDDKIASLLSVVMPRSRCTCKHKRGWEVLRKRGVRNKQVSLFEQNSYSRYPKEVCRNHKTQAKHR